MLPGWDYSWSMIKGTIFDLKRYAINDGPGIRTAVFLKGCPLDCWWCHNPEGRERQPQLMVRANRCRLCGDCVAACPQSAIRLDEKPVTDLGLCQDCGACAQVCVQGARELVGRVVSVAEILAEVERDVVFFDQSGGGVTLTGGDPLMQPRFAIELLRACQAHGIHTTLDTSGYAAWKVVAEAVQHTDLFLYDLKLMDDRLHRKYTGVSNRLILSNLRRLSAAGAQIIVRIPLIPGVNDDEQNLHLAQQFLASLPRVVGVEVLPYHDIAQAKYTALDLEYRLSALASPSAERVDWAKSLFGI
jgi:pyruvate formate lyase activating enzyme